MHTANVVSPSPLKSAAGAKVSALAALLSILFLIWAPLANGQLFFWPDSTNYIRAGGAALTKLVSKSLGNDWYPGPANAPAAEPLPPPAVNAETGEKPSVPAPTLTAVNDPSRGSIMAGRSPYVGVLMFLAGRFGRFWPYALGLAALQLALMQVAFRLFGISSPFWRWGSVVLVAVLTPAAFFNGYLMADAFCAFGLFAFLLWICAPCALTALQRALLMIAMVLATVSHLTHIVVIAAPLLVCALLVLLRRGKHEFREARWAIPAAGAALLLGIISIAVTNRLIEKTFGKPPLQVPMLTARFIEDGPGVEFIEQGCDETRFAVCKARGQVPSNSQSFLWGTSPKDGLFLLASPEEQRLISAQDTRFALAVFAEFPVSESLAMLKNTALQFTSFGVDEFNYGTTDGYQRKIPAGDFATLSNTLSAHNLWPVSLLGGLYWVGFLLASVGLALAYRQSFQHDDVRARNFRLMVLLLALALVANAFICGAASIPQARYMARVIWLPLFIACLGAALFLQAHLERRVSRA